LLFTSGIAVDSSENVLISDGVTRRVRRVDASTGLISTVAGKDVGSSGGYGGPATAEQLNGPAGIALDSPGDLFISEHNQSTIEEVNGSTGIITLFAGSERQGFSGDAGPATSAELFNPRGVAVDVNGNLYIADNFNNVIRKVEAATGIITTVAGNTSIVHSIGNISGIPAPGYSGDGGPATSAQLSRPQDVFVDSAGNLFIADGGNNVVRRVDAKTQVITTAAGNYSLGAGFSGDNGPASSARLSGPAGIAADVYGNLYIADAQNYRVREVNAVTGIITTLAGNGIFTFAGDGGPASSAGLWPYLPGLVALAPDAEGNIRVLVMDGTSGRTRVITIPPVPAVSLPSASLGFASQMVGSSSSRQFFTIANSGTGTLRVTNVAVTGADAADFIVSPGGTCPGSGFTLAPTASCTIAVTFLPIATGTRLAFVTLTDNAAGSPQAVALQGTAVQQPATQESITLPLSPTAPNQFQFDNGVHNFTVQYPAGSSFSGANMTVTAAQTPQAMFQQRVASTPFANASCIVYEGEDGYCEDYQVRCTSATGVSISCPGEPNPTISVKTSYDTEQSIINPGFLKAPIGTNAWSNIFTAFYLQRIDPTTKGHTTGFSEFFAVDLGATDAQGAGAIQMLWPLQQQDPRVFTTGIPILVAFTLTSLAHPGRPVTDAIAGLSVMQVSDANGTATSNTVLEKASAFAHLENLYFYLVDTLRYPPGRYIMTVYGDAFAAQQVQFRMVPPKYK
jgi:sugar lactone lactonase YvrE